MERERTHLAFLDGLRGLTALFVLLHHAALEVPWESMSGWLAAGTRWLDYGHYAVAVFIVLSGFSLMIPVVKTGEIRGGFRGYIVRRARRILPAYYAALILSLLLIGCCARLAQTGDPRWEHALPAFSLRSAILPHCLLVQNLRRGWIFRIDPPMWSVATEWQIYFLFPALIGAWRRWGVPALVALGFAVGIVIGLGVGVETARLMCPWYAGLFATGMAAAVSVFDGPGKTPAWSERSLWFIPGALAVGLTLSPGLALQDAMVGAATAALLVYCARRHEDRDVGNDPPALLRLLGSRCLTGLGALSYSLYLVHYPILVLATAYLVQFGFGSDAQVFILLSVVSPLVLVASYWFHRLFERPFMASASRPARTAGTVAAWSPAT